MEPLLNEQLKEPNYSQMIARLSVMKREQIKQGGFSKAVTVIEDYIENRTVLNRSDNFDNVIGFPLGQMMFICSTTAVFSVCLLIFTLYLLYRLICFLRYVFENKSKQIWSL